MADNRPLLEKLVGMLGSEHNGEPDGNAINALRKIKQIAKAENKSLADLLMTGKAQIIYQDRVVYRDRDPARPHPKPNHSEGFHSGRGSGFDWEEMARRAAQNEANRRRREREEAEAAAADSRQRYAGAFDDAEMTDEQREAARARRKARKEGGPKQRRAWDTRTLLDELAWALENNDDDLTGYEIEFASNVPFQYRFDYELSKNQIEVLKRIVRKVKSGQAGSPI